MTFPALRSALLASIALVPAPLMAQEVAAADQPASSTTIIVTSQKIEQRAQDVPITISAVTGDRIEELGVSDLDELSNYVPGLNIQEQSANNPGIVIRGITSDSGSSQQGPRVTLYYNGVDISRSRGSYQAIYDLERVEVIKGPQATLFGTASAVGAISLVSARPRAGFSGEITGGYGNFDQTLLGGYLNAGSDVLAGRIAFEWRQRDGYVENLNPGQDEELYAQDQFGVRASLRYTPSMDLTIDLIGTYDQQRNGGTPFISGTLPAFAGAPGGPGNAFEDANLGGYPAGAATLGDDQLGLDREVYDLNLTAAYEFGDNWTFTTVNGYREFDSAEVFDADGSAAPFLEFAEIAQGHQFSHEGRFSYAGSALRASFGWNFFTEDGLQNVPFATEEGTFLQCLTSLFGAPLIAGIPCVAPDGSVPATGVTALATNGAANAIPYASVFENQGRNEAYSVFADVTWLATDSLELTAGARLLEENRKSAYRSNVPDAVLSGAPLIPGQIDTGGREQAAAVSTMPGTSCRTGRTFRKRRCGTTRPGSSLPPAGSRARWASITKSMTISRSRSRNWTPTATRPAASSRGARGRPPTSAWKPRSRSRPPTGSASSAMSAISTAGSTRTTASPPSFRVRVSASSPNGRPQPVSRSTIRWAAGHGCSPPPASRIAAGSTSKCPTAN